MRYELIEYSAKNLIDCLVDRNHTSVDIVLKKRHTVFFEQYFKELRAKTIIVEREYVDRDYLQDYAAYYDRCFYDHARKTRRLHFFSLSFSDEQLNDLVIGRPGMLTEKRLQRHYLGFIVVRPLPRTIIGRTCLKTYGSDSGRRVFPSLRDYSVSLFGINLQILSLAFQEQDTVVAACATSALWTCFHGTGKLFQHSIPAPVEITDWASAVMPENLLAPGARAFPNTGLTARQMAHAIKKVDLDPVAVRAGTLYSLNSVAYAYLRGKIPSLLGCQISRHDPISGQIRDVGAHAVAIVGYSLKDESDENALVRTNPQGAGLPEDGFRLRASRIDKLYVHDDQNGPFSRLEWCLPPTLIDSDGSMVSVTLKTSWPSETYAVPDFLLLPLYHKIRIPFSLILKAIKALDAALELFRSKTDLSQRLERAEWDIYLVTGSDYKSSVREEYVQEGLDPSHCLYADLPRFMWRAILRCGDTMHADMLFDATGIEQGNLLVHSYDTGREYSLLLTLFARYRQAIVRGAHALEPLPDLAQDVLDAFV